MTDTFYKLENLLFQDKALEAVELLQQYENVDVNSKAELFHMFNDEISDDILYSVVHMLESIGHEQYIELYLERLARIFEKSPTWASVLLIRIVNHNQSFQILKSTLSQDISRLKLVKLVREEALKIKRDMPEIN